MKIAHISTTSKGGAGIAAFRIHQSLLNNQLQSCFVQKTLNPEAANNIYRCTHYHNLYYRLANKLGLTQYVTLEGKYKHKISEYPVDYELASVPFSYFPIEEHPAVKEADIVHLHWVAEFLNYPSFFKKIKQPIVWTLHDMNPFMGIFHYEGDAQRAIMGLKGIEARILEKKIKDIHKSNNLHIVCLAEWMKEKSEKSIAFKSYPHNIIPNGLDVNSYPILDKNECRQKLNISNNKKNILFAAQQIDVKRKGADLLLDALKGLDTSSFNLITIGGGDIDVDKRINHIKRDHVSSIAELNTAYSAADITIIPSREDNLPNIMLESLMNGTPVISFANGGMREYISTGENGILVDKIDADNLRLAIEDFINGKYIFDKEKIRNTAIQTFSDKLQAQRYIDLYKEILNKQ